MKILNSKILLIPIIGLFSVIVTAAGLDYSDKDDRHFSDRSDERRAKLNRRRLRLRNLYKCPTQRIEHEVFMKKYSDSTGYWVLYTQIIETRNVGNQCHRNEYVYLAHRQKAGWIWNPKYNSLVHYSLDEPQFIARRVNHPNRIDQTIMVNMNKKYAPQAYDYDRIFPRRLAESLTSVGPDDLKWSELARSTLPILQMTEAHFELVKAEENSGVEKIKVLDDQVGNQEVPE